MNTQSQPFGLGGLMVALAVEDAARLTVNSQLYQRSSTYRDVLDTTLVAHSCFVERLGAGQFQVMLPRWPAAGDAVGC